MTESDDNCSPSVLENLIKRPAMYWGNSDNHFHSFIAFLSGYQLAQDDIVDDDARRQLDEIIPPSFHEFVTEYYGHTFPHGGYRWMTFIEENTESDQEALEAFLKLRRLYDLHHKGEQDAAPNEEQRDKPAAS